MLIFDHDFRILTKFSKIGQHVPYVAILMEISIFIYDLLTINWDTGCKSIFKKTKFEVKFC